MKIKALIFDRDGTLIEHLPYLSDPAKVSLLPGVKDLLQKAREAEVLLFLHTNQSGVGRGFFDLSAVNACNDRMIELLDLGPTPFSRICIAPEAPDKPSDYRKPSPRFAQEIMQDFSLGSEQICYIGDRGSDLQTAFNAGTRAIGVSTGLNELETELTELGLAQKYPVLSSMTEVTKYFFA